jgi:hypothetical protein
MFFLCFFIVFQLFQMHIFILFLRFFCQFNLFFLLLCLFMFLNKFWFFFYLLFLISFNLFRKFLANRFFSIFNVILSWYNIWIWSKISNFIINRIWNGLKVCTSVCIASTCTVTNWIAFRFLFLFILDFFLI